MENEIIYYIKNEYRIPYVYVKIDNHESLQKIHDLIKKNHEFEPVNDIEALYLGNHYLYNYDLLTIFLSIIDLTNSGYYNVTSSQYDFFSDDIKKLNSELVQKFIIGRVESIKSKINHFPNINMVNNISPLIDICKFIYENAHFEINDGIEISFGHDLITKFTDFI